jgi:hypothetical protein
MVLGIARCRAVVVCGIEYIWGIEVILGAPLKPENERGLGPALIVGPEWIVCIGAEWVIGAERIIGAEGAILREKPPGIPPPPVGAARRCASALVTTSGPIARIETPRRNALDRSMKASI